ncbi:hypothetical protein LXL04_001229 [Taraxacum kok-saghyz]
MLSAQNNIGRTIIPYMNKKGKNTSDESESGRVDLGMFFAILSPICCGSPEKRKRVAFDSLLWWPVNEQQQEDESESGRVDLGMFFAILSPICCGSPEKRKRVAFDSLLWWPVNEQQQEGKGQIIRVDALRYIKLLRLIYIPSQGTSELLEIHGETDDSMVSFTEFTAMFDDSDWGFGI